MRVETLLRICRVLKVTPDEILTYDEQTPAVEITQTLERLLDASSKTKETAARLISVYLDSLD